MSFAGGAKFSALPMGENGSRGGGRSNNNGSPPTPQVSRPSSWTFHIIMALSQSLLIFLWSWAGDLDARSGQQLYGHIGIWFILLSIGVRHLYSPADQPWHQTLKQDGLSAIIFGSAFIVAEFLFINHKRDPIRKFPRWGDHSLMSFWMVLLGVMCLLIGKHRVEQFARIPIVIGTIAWVLFIGAHGAPRIEGKYAHVCCATWIALAGATKIFAPKQTVLAGCCLVISSYLMYCAQFGMIEWAIKHNDVHIEGSPQFKLNSFLLMWHCTGTAIATIYVAEILNRCGYELSSAGGEGMASYTDDDDDDDEKEEGQELLEQTIA